MIMFEHSPARDFLRSLGGQVERPDAIVLISAHHDMPGAVVTSTERPETIYDFGGFPQALYDMRYPAPGAPALAALAALMLPAAES